jgi:hypothetical protein
MFIVMPGVYWFPGEDGASKTRGIHKSVLERYKPKTKAAWDAFDNATLSKTLIYSSQRHMAPSAFRGMTNVGMREYPSVSQPTRKRRRQSLGGAGGRLGCPTPPFAKWPSGSA